MYSHHKIAIETITNKLKSRDEVLGIIIGGSVAHGFANEKSDIDLMLVLSDKDYEEALKSGNINYFETESTPYEGGYVDGKCTSVDYIKNEGLKRNNKYLMDISISNFVLFAGRLILAYNETLYPYHKWFLKVLEGVKNKPDNLLLYINNVLENKTGESIETLYNSIIGCNKWSSSDKHWCIRFMLDSELNWMNGYVPIADL